MHANRCAALIVLAAVLFLTACPSPVSPPSATPTPLSSVYIYYYSGASDAYGTMSPQSVLVGRPVILNSNLFYRNGYTFAGWSTSQGGPVVYYANTYYTFYAATTLYAVWNATPTPTPATPTPATPTPATPTPISSVYIYYNGGAPDAYYYFYMSPQYVTVGQPVILRANQFYRNGYTFAGWATSQGGPVAYYANTYYTFYAATTLYAVWNAAPTPTPATPTPATPTPSTPTPATPTPATPTPATPTPATPTPATPTPATPTPATPTPATPTPATPTPAPTPTPTTETTITITLQAPGEVAQPILIHTSGSVLRLFIDQFTTNCRWYLDGVVIPDETGSLLVYDISPLASGTHNIAAFSLLNGKLYSRSINFSK